MRSCIFRKLTSAMLLMGLMALSSMSLHAKTVYVKVGGAGTGDGSSLANASATVWDVLSNPARVAPGDEIRVLAGTYSTEADWDMTNAVKGTSLLPITVVSYDATGTVKTPLAAKITADHFVYYPHGNFFHVLEGLDFAAPATKADFFEMRGADVTFLRCSFHDSIDGNPPIFNHDDNPSPGTIAWRECVFYNINTSGNNGQIIYVKYGPQFLNEVVNLVIDKCTFIGNLADAGQDSTGSLVRARNDNRNPARYPGVINLQITNSIFADSPKNGVSDNQVAPGQLNLTESNNAFFNVALQPFQSGHAPAASDKIGVNPLFVNAATDDYHLQAGSTYRGAGTGGANIGYDQGGVAPLIIYVAKGGAGNQSGSSWANAAPSIYGVLTGTTVQPGTEVRVKGNTYDNDGNWDMTSSVAGTLANPITVVSYSADGSAPEAGAVKLTGDFYRYWPAGSWNHVFNGIDFAGPVGTSDFFQVRGTDLTFIKCLFHGAQDGNQPVFNFDDNPPNGSITWSECIFYDIHTTGANGQIIYVKYGPQLVNQVCNLNMDKCTLVGNPGDPGQDGAGSLFRARNDNRTPPRYYGTINMNISNTIFADAPKNCVSDDQVSTGVLNLAENHNAFFNYTLAPFHSGHAPDSTDKVGVDPKFVSPSSLDYHLQSGSTLRGAGTSGVNIGWDQSVATAIFYVAKGGAGTQDGSSWANAAPSVIGLLTSPTLVTAGAEIRVKGGTYDTEGNWDMSGSVKGTAAKPITVVAYDAAGTAPSPGDVKYTGDFYRFWPAGSYYHVFDGLDWAGPVGTSDFFQVRGTDLTFIHCLFHGAQAGNQPVFNFDDNPPIGSISWIECIFYDIKTTGNNGQIIYVKYGPVGPGDTCNLNMDKCTLVGNLADTGQTTSGSLFRARNDNRFPPRYYGTINMNISNSLFVDSVTNAVADDQYSTGVLTVSEHHNGFFNIALKPFSKKTPVDPTDKVNVDPLFVSPGTLNYRLKNVSPMLRAGSSGANIGWDQLQPPPNAARLWWALE